jgi:hypothetical protein
LLAEFFRGAVDRLCVAADGRQGIDGPAALLVAGAFNPVHAGHWGLAEAAARMVGKPAAFELCIANVDKAPLNAAEVEQRLRPFAGRAAVWMTRAATFVEKARLFPGSVFAVGADTAARIIEPRYYGGRAADLAAALTELRRHGNHFLVACRVDASGRCLSLDDLEIPAEHRDLFHNIPPQEFRLDVSSSALRTRPKSEVSPAHGRTTPA